MTKPKVALGTSRIIRMADSRSLTFEQITSWLQYARTVNIDDGFAQFLLSAAPMKRPPCGGLFAKRPTLLTVLTGTLGLSILARLLNVRPLQAIGLISYSLYLWQQLWMSPELHLSLPVALTGALASGVASYWLVEQTALRWRKRLEQKVFARD